MLSLLDFRSYLLPILALPLVAAHGMPAEAFDSRATSPLLQGGLPVVRVGENGTAETSAFESARELGTADAWTAFLASYPNGFHADLARAYLKKLAGAERPPASAGSVPQPTSAEVVPATTANGGTHEISCGERASITSRTSDVPAKITFSNRSGMVRALVWIGFKGELKTYATLNPGQDVALDTFVTHPWMVTDGPGNCIHVFMPAAGPTQVTLGAAGPYVDPPKAAVEPPKTVRRTSEEPPPKKTVTSKKPESSGITCSAGKSWNGKQCVANPYLDNKGRPMDGYYADKHGNIHQDNGGGE